VTKEPSSVEQWRPFHDRGALRTIWQTGADDSADACGRSGSAGIPYRTVVTQDDDFPDLEELRVTRV
jgi:hypothetical protein